MKPAAAPRPDCDQRLLVVDPHGNVSDARLVDLGRWLRRGDALVVNDAATLPGSLQGALADGSEVEARLCSEASPGRWSAVLFGAGDWHTRTEDRTAPPHVEAGDVVRFGVGLAATVVHVSPLSPRLIDLVFAERDADFWAALYTRGRPVQYAHVERPLALWEVQTRYAARPWAAEMPSAGRPLAWEILLGIARKGVELAPVTHAAGLSATGDPVLDAALPLDERYDVPQATVDAIHRTQARGGRVVAVGTTVVRALEGAAQRPSGLVAGQAETDLRLEAGAPLRVVGGLLTGLHEPSASHYRLLQAFAPRAVIDRAYAAAERAGYVHHEFGDSNLLLAQA